MISSGSKQVDAAKALIAFLTSPAAKQALRANGFETPWPGVIAAAPPRAKENRRAFNVRSWHPADLPASAINVRLLG
jgi:ABC-type Fe3+ transport system substrate-binding protein